ncbi:MAG: glycoside hydrolase family 97 N-terminal domain-containing protein, partial [Saprospiraceae bacterium]
MKHNPFAFFAIPLFFSFVLAGCQKKQQVTEFLLTSPNGKLEVTVSLNERGEPLYAVQYDGQSVITPSGLGMELQGQKPLKSRFEVVEVREEAIEERWTMPWGEQREVENDYAHLMLGLRETEM